MASKSADTPPPNPVAALRKPPKAFSGAWLWELVKSYGSAILLFLVLRTFFVEAFRIPSGSMQPTLLIGDWLFVNKLRYGPHVPFTTVNLPGYAEPQRLDVVVFESPNQIDQPEDPTPTLVKRLQGMPGDTLLMRNGVLQINGTPTPQPAAMDVNPKGDPDETSSLYAWQHPHEIRGSRFGEPPAVLTHDNWGPLVVPAQHYFMMGDNRYNSKDSRYWGLVPRANVRGRPLFVYYAWNADDSDRVLPMLTDIRWSRLGHWIK